MAIGFSVTRYLLIFFLLPLNLCAQQPAEAADQRQATTAYSRVASIGPDQWVFSGSAWFFGSEAAFLTARNDAGQTLWNADISVFGQGINARVVEVLSDGFIATGPVFFCDLMPDIVSGIVRTDLMGQLIWQYPLDTMVIGSVIARSDGLLAFGDTPTPPFPPGLVSHILLLNPDGTEHAYWTTDYDSPRTVRWDVDNSLLALFDEGLVRYSDTGQELNANAIPTGALDLVVIGTDSAYVLYADRVVRYDNGFNALDSIDFIGWSTARWMEESDGKLWITCSAHFVSVDLSDHSASGFATEPLLGHSVYGTAVSNGLIMTAGSAVINERSAGVARSYSTSGTVAQHDLDVALFINSIDSSRIDTFGLSNELVRFHLWTTLRLENLGMEPVTKVFLNYHLLGIACGWNDISIAADSLILLPGESVLLAAPEAISDIIYCPVGSQVGPQLCIVAISPNDLVDRDPTNNEGCGVVTYLNTTGIPENAGPRILTIAPQPFTDQFTIQLSEPLHGSRRLLLFDATGREVYRKQLPSEEQILNVVPPELLGGAYLVRIETSGGVATQRVLKVP